MCAKHPVSRETDAAAKPAAPEGVSRETPKEAGLSPAPRRNPVSRAAVAVLLLPLRGYRRFISPGLPARCRYYPSCSAYAEQAIRELGPFKGLVLAVWRVLRCNPLSSGGLDPLDNRRLFRSSNSADAPSPGAEATH